MTRGVRRRWWAGPQGIALAGFNVVDIHALHEALGMAVLVVFFVAGLALLSRVRD